MGVLCAWTLCVNTHIVCLCIVTMVSHICILLPIGCSQHCILRCWWWRTSQRMVALWYVVYLVCVFLCACVVCMCCVHTCPYMSTHDKQTSHTHQLLLLLYSHSPLFCTHPHPHPHTNRITQLWLIPLLHFASSVAYHWCHPSGSAWEHCMCVLYLLGDYIYVCVCMYIYCISIYSICYMVEWAYPTCTCTHPTCTPNTTKPTAGVCWTTSHVCFVQLVVS